MPSPSSTTNNPLFLSSQLPPIILASASPRRCDILTTLGLAFQVIPADIDEASMSKGIHEPKQHAIKLSQAKCSAIATKYPSHLVIGSDTIVTQHGNIFGKPHHADDAFSMLNELQGNSHEVISSITVMYQGKQTTLAPSTTVYVSPMSHEEIQAYISTGDPMDKAGAYGIQGCFAPFIQRIEGCYFNVVGLSPHGLKQAVTDCLS